MKKQKRNLGFTMAEVLLVVALIAVLSGVAFIAVWNHLRALTQLEYDGIAKEIFVAAQNHLSMAENQGYLQASKDSDYGTPDTQNVSKNVYYFVVNKGDLFGSDGNLVLKLMLPFAAVDETVRAGGNYLIQYQAEPALVMNVFYSSPSGRFGHQFTSGEYSTLLGLADDSKKSDRRNYKGDVIGWYGGEEARNLPIGEPLKEPTIEVINRERLQVKVSNPNSSGELKLIIKGMSSNKEKEFVLVDKVGTKNYWDGTGFTVTLDDITVEGGHFADLFQDFLPGEDISIQAVAFNNALLTNIAYSAEKTTNSLYADLETKEETGNDGTVSSQNMATIAFVRHLENLDKRVSKLSEKIPVNSAQQITDLSWTSFEAEINENNHTLDQSVSVWYDNTKTGTGCFLPVIPPQKISYDGLLHRISDIKVDIADNAGIFGKTTDGSITSLLVIDSDFKATSGNAGALIGEMSGTIVQGCAAFATVSGSADTGGLIGFASGGRIEGCYSAGHTDRGAYPAAKDNSKPYDVRSTDGSAGGLIGNAANTVVSSCYSTCSVSGNTAGGFIGTGTNTDISNSYATGLVKGTKEGAFAGEFPGTLSGNKYYEIINERVNTDTSGKEGSFKYLHPIGLDSEATETQTLPPADQISALDASASSYNSFCGDPKNWKTAEPKDKALEEWYQKKYNLKTISQLLGSNAGNAEYDFFDTHYGDWPAPEIFIINQ